MGAVILNQDMTVMQTNKAAQEISQIFWEQYRHNQGHFLRSNYQGDPKFREVQTMINEISERLTTQAEPVRPSLLRPGTSPFITPRFSPPARRA